MDDPVPLQDDFHIDRLARDRSESRPLREIGRPPFYDSYSLICVFCFQLGNLVLTAEHSDSVGSRRVVFGAPAYVYVNHSRQFHQKHVFRQKAWVFAIE